MHDRELLSFNFWPSFGDVVLGLVLMLCLVLCAVSVSIAVRTVDGVDIEENQRGLVDSVALAYDTKPVPLSEDSVGIYVRNGAQGEPDLEFHNSASAQRVIFNDDLLFAADDVTLLPEGRAAVERVGTEILRRLSAIEEIQVRGHADTVPSRRYPSNMELAAGQAVAVFTFLQNGVGIDPAENLVSVTSFGQYVSARRSTSGEGYTMAKLLEDNASAVQRSRNRRVELLITYRH